MPANSPSADTASLGQSASRFWGPLLLIMLLGLGVRTWHLQTNSFDYDEAYEILHAETDLSVLISRHDGFPPLYRWITGNLFALTGNDQIFRWFSAFVGTATIGLVGLLGKCVAGPRVGFVSAFFVAISANHVLISQLGRGYSLYVFFSCALLISAWHLRGKDSHLAWASFLLFAWLSIATHYYAVILVFILGALLLAVRSIFVTDRIAGPKRAIVAAMLLVLLCLPHLHCFKSDLGPTNEFYHKVQFDLEAYAFSYYRLVSGNTLGPSITELRELGAGPGIKRILPWALVIFLPIIVLFASAWQRLERKHSLWLGILILAPPPIILLAAQIAPTGYSYRYMAWIIVPWMVLLGCGAAFTRKKPWETLSTLLLITLSLFAIYNRHYDSQYADQDFHAAIGLIEGEAKEAGTPQAVLAAPSYFGEAVVYALPDDWIGMNITASPKIEQDWDRKLPMFIDQVGKDQEAWLITPWYPKKDPRHKVCEQLIERLDAKLLSRTTPTVMVYRLEASRIE